ncbi:MAG TPA: hypothetical protein VFD70_23270 [Anaerolineae bacterium]|nr:hypothetical protein [Anaerolineae bacterium]
MITLIRDWQALGATMFSLNMMGAGLDSARAHMNAVKKFAQAILAYG